MIAINDVLYEPAYFPDGTLRLRCEVTEKIVDLQWKWENNEEVLIVYFLTHHLRNVCKVETINLIMPYIPNARMDRVKDVDEVFTLKYFTELINGLQFDSVHVLDAHSSVSLALLNQVVSDDFFPMIERLANQLLVKEEDIVFFPDEGACKRYSESIQKESAFGIKKRDWRTGEIKGLDIVGGTLKKGFNVLIIDDICSYGGTFYHSAKKLKELGADKIWLYVTHCENSVLEGDLINSGLIEMIYTTDSIFTKKSPHIQIIERGL
ncbi:MAG: ribose-phosphate pyrophosphokinae [Clostridiales bacterium]|jgi:ribose-phosphate pyrophosphokinase|nr:ribose-phosphate pyrophosphokinae [Clostridiales bacterium]